MRLAHDGLPEALRRPRTADDPVRLMVSGCIAGWPCGVDGTAYGMEGALAELLALPAVTPVPFCPEEHALGVPRGMPDLHGGDGFDVLDGTARALDEHGNDLTAGMIEGALAMVERAEAERVDLAVLTDMSAACGTQVISDGCRFDEPRRYQQGVGVAAAALIRAGIPVVSQRDHATLGRLRALWDPTFTPAPDAKDHHETDWVIATFGGA